MIKDFYVQVDEENRVRDILSYPFEDYRHIRLNTPLPPRVVSGAYEYTDNGLIHRPEWDSAETDQKIAALEKTIAELMLEVASISKEASR